MPVQYQRMFPGLSKSRLVERRHEIRRDAMLPLTLQLIREFTDATFFPDAACKRCGNVLSAPQILAGLREQRSGHGIVCPICRSDVEPTLRVHPRAESPRQVPFLSVPVTLAALRDRLRWANDPAAVADSATMHFGSVPAARRQVERSYPYRPPQEWAATIRTIRPFLGRLPDTIIAACADVRQRHVREYRISLGIGRYRPAGPFSTEIKTAA